MAPTSYPDAQDAGWLEALAEQADQPPQPTEPSDGTLLWWPLALSEALKSDKPLGVSLGGRPIVLWRDAQGEPRAMIDQCPHRRVPLSLGRVTSDGLLQCGYHGWCYEGRTGRVTRIPNLLEKQRFPLIYRGESYGVYEADGFIRVCLNKDAPPPQADADRLPLHGTTPVALGHAHYVAMLFDDPSLLLDIPGVDITEYFDSELTWADGVAQIDRHCVRRWHLKSSRLGSHFPFRLRVQTALATGETNVQLLSDSLDELSRIHLAPTPGARGTTTVNWRAKAGGRPFAGLRRSAPEIRVRGDLDVGRIAATRPTVSVQFRGEMQQAS
ncbi:Rieske (2Fe-2S) protein [Sphingomonas populi]|uniref:Rieske (2Fe-2S) protein n=1 Tax=Sphingomonas populi TaxID=2484750 RepID=A0A4Q6XU05_9SPHN|nr:Rieske 2Fe-2S domain-containing protein [Sphingomonas populi]RZF63451.1 Rieske (2Fe-2S) protein [Sphingomonas populi]